MHISRLSVRPFIALLIVILSMSVVAFASSIYRTIALENQHSMLTEVLQREADRLLLELDDVTVESAIHLNSDKQFRQALSAQDYSLVKRFLDSQFKQYLISAGILRLVQIYVYSPGFELLSQSSLGPFASDRTQALCDNLVHRASQRKGTDRFKIHSGLCAHLNRPFYSVIVPVGGFKQRGYIQVVVDPLHNFSTIEARLGLPIKLAFNNGTAGYRSAVWESTEAQPTLFEISYWLTDEDQRNILGVFVQKNMETFLEQTTLARNQLLLAAALTTFIAVFITFVFLDKATISPLRTFVDQAKKARLDHRPLRAPIDIEANSDITELVTMFNQMHSDLATLHDQYEQIAFFDPLTQLPNRRLFKDRLEQMVLLSERRGERLAILLIDLDNFKEINERFGHQTGDRWLQEIADRLNKTLRASSTLARMGHERHIHPLLKSAHDDDRSTVARLGGDEFAILLPHLSGSADAMSVAMRVNEALTQPKECDRYDIPVSATMGIAIYPEHGNNGESLLNRAELALYAAKSEQSDFFVYDAGHEQHRIEQLELKVELRHAIENGALTLCFQPKLDLKHNRISSVEALVRWHHPRYGDIEPSQFIKLSEHKGLIAPLTEWVIEHAIQQHQVWAQMGVIMEIAINISSRVLYDISLPNKIEQMLTASGLSSSAICLEISEEATMIDPRKLMEALVLLNKMGIRLAIDDFGTGFSSLGLLKHLPLDEIKIDKSFVTEMAHNSDDASIVRATVELAHNLGLSAVAEGVESEEVLEMLHRLGCDFAQGFYVCDPLSPEQFVEWLEASAWG